jgi:hypothetical protein
MELMSKLRQVCRLAPGQTSADCPQGTAGSTDGRLDEGDLPPEILVRGFQARYQWLDRHPNDYAGARAAQLRVLAPHLDSLNRAAHAASAKEDSHVCNCQKPHHVDGARVDDDGYDLDGNPTPATARRAAAAMFGQPSVFRDGAHAPSAPARQDDDTDENAAARRMRGQWTAGRR